MYTLEQLQQKTFKKLKEIGWELNALPAGDKRCRQNWIEAIAGVRPPLLELLETSPGVEVEPVTEAIAQLSENSPGVTFNVEEFQQTHAAEIDAYVASFTDDRPPNRGSGDRGRLETEPKMSQSAIALADNLTPGEANGNRTDTHIFTGLRADAHHSVRTAAKLHGSSICIKSSTLQHEESDRVLEKSRDSQGGEGRTLPHQSHELVAIFNDEQPSNRGDGRGRRTQQTPVTFSERFLAAYPPYFGEVCYKVEITGQLNLLESETDDEPPDPDDFESLDAFREAMAAWDATHPELIEIGLDSFREWAPCPEEWYEPSEVLELSPPILSVCVAPVGAGYPNETSSTCNFSIPTFDAWCDRRNDTDEPPDTGIFARLPKPKPPSFGPMSVAAGDRSSSIKKFARCATLSSGRAPPGGDAH